MATKKAFWISFDLGLKGDYSGLYTWLDTIEAKECGDGVAFFQKAYPGDFKEQIKKEIEKHVNVNKNDRIYLIYLDHETGKVKGNFIFGNRKRAPWEGFAAGPPTDDDSI